MQNKKITTLVALTCVLSTQSVFAKTLVGMIQTPQCFSAHYDAAHLKAHPKQKVTTLWVYVLPAKMFDYGDEPKLMSDYGQVIVRFKDDKADYISDGMYCTVESGDIWHCGIECDGGRFTLQANPTGTVLLKQLYESIRVTSCGDTPKNRHIQTIDDQKLFALRPTSLAACKRLIKKY